MNPFDFKGKVALVTGSASGIGRAAALAFAEAGAKVVGADVNAAGGERVTAEIKNAGGEATFICTDVSRPEEVKALIRGTVELYGGLDFAHNNAGIEGTRARVAGLSEADWDRAIAINLKGVWLCMKFEIEQMAKQRRGAIVNTASVAGHIGLSRYGAYAASKHGVIGLTKTAALEYMRIGLRINAISPGFIDTAMFDRALSKTSEVTNGLWQQLRRRVARTALTIQQPARRMGTPEEVAQSVLWLCSDSASFVNGHTLVVDGGLLAQ